ncbi:MAG: hypothetical protein M3340_00165 [Actinomycetota bacterium]|nr:hypothetical protein [Actinomycetota bacterium]
MNAAEQVFLEALEDLRDGREQPVERYLDRVPATERRLLADLLASYFASREEPADPYANAELFERTLAAVDRVAAEESGQAGVLPGMLVELSRTRGLKRGDVVTGLQSALGLPDRARDFLAELYHRLESGRVPGSGLHPRLITALGQVFKLPDEEVDAARRPLGPPHALRAALAFGRGGGELGAVEDQDRPQPPVEEDLRQVFLLFYGGHGA